ncbi:L-rhamnose operon regulatory protein rhaS [Leminorella grimontii]|nr:L-rhamnose operon regulatory protein rhaS [Leminorella grimontii]
MEALSPTVSPDEWSSLPTGKADRLSLSIRPLPLSTKDVRINTLLAFLRKNLQQPHSLDALAKRVMMSRRTFTRQFNQATGMSVGEWLETERLQRAQELLESANQSIESVAQAVGFPVADIVSTAF